MLENNKFQDEKEIAESLILQSDFLDDPSIASNAKEIINFCRKNKNKGTKLDAFMEEYGLSNHEGIALMCLAESLIRIPDNETRNSLINEKLTSSKWSKHLNQAESFLVNSATLGLKVSKSILLSKNWLTSLGRKLGEDSIREAIRLAMKVLSNEFVFSENIEDLKSSSFLKANKCSFDMLGEAARTKLQEEKYFGSYLNAIKSTSKLNNSLNTRNGVSIKLSALYSKFDAIHAEEVEQDLYPKLYSLCEEAKSRNVPITIDAEEQDRLTLSLVLITKILKEEEFQKWDEIGLAVQAYGKRSLQIIEHINESLKNRDSIHLRLVKGAYWDYEIKEAQRKGLLGYPVFTNKSVTDLNFLLSAKTLLDSPKIMPLFATHNAYSISAINQLNKKTKREIEFQRLYGMGELLYKGCEEVLYSPNPLSVYCPVGEHKELLPYLVRRLLENGANSSFINNLLNKEIEVDQLSKNPSEIIEKKTIEDFSWIPLPQDLYKPRINSKGFDLSEKEEIDNIFSKIEEFKNKKYRISSLTNIEINKSDKEILTFTDNLEKNHEIEFIKPEALLKIEIKASNKWKKESINNRSEILKEVAKDIEENPYELISLLMREVGKTLPDACDEIREAVDLLRFYAHEARKIQKTSELRGYTGELNLLDYEPKGICLCLSPWNFPLAITIGQIAASLVVGNTVIAKPSEKAPLIAQKVLTKFFEKGLPEDALFSFLGDGSIGEKIIQTQDVDLVAFTGSLKTAKNINKELAKKEGKIVPLISETGGLNAMVVDSSALIERACDDVIRSAFNSAGQRCSSLRVLLVQKEIYSETIKMIEGAVDNLNLGSPFKKNTDIGPIIDRKQLLDLEEYSEEFKKLNKIKYQVNLKKELLEKYFPPTLIELDSLEEVKEEKFGPILHIISYEGSELKNLIVDLENKGFALTLGIHTRIDSKISEISNLTSTGNIYVNRDIVGAVVESQPFGGNNLSGSGLKAGGPNYLIQFLNEKSTSINTVAIGGNPELLNKKSIT